MFIEVTAGSQGAYSFSASRIDRLNITSDRTIPALVPGALGFRQNGSESCCYWQIRVGDFQMLCDSRVHHPAISDIDKTVAARAIPTAGENRQQSIQARPCLNLPCV